ncbi:MAG: class I SAM-dependent methyltransferase [Terriglobales bacterium]
MQSPTQIPIAEGPTAETPVSNYDRPEVVEQFSRSVELFDCERYAFDKYIPRGKRILDLGVGAGRTTVRLTEGAAAYVGIDYAPNMIAACRKRFPQYQFQVDDAAALATVADASFDVVVFSFNGIDYLSPDSARLSCLQHCRRVLVGGGLLIFSAHNARGIFVRPRLRGAPLWKKGWRLLRAPVKSATLIWRIAFSRAFLQGHGYIWEPDAGGCVQHMTTRQHMMAELAAAGFRVLETVPHDHPVPTGSLTTPWYYYVAQKS